MEAIKRNKFAFGLGVILLVILFIDGIGFPESSMIFFFLIFSMCMRKSIAVDQNNKKLVSVKYIFITYYTWLIGSVGLYLFFKWKNNEPACLINGNYDCSRMMTGIFYAFIWATLTSLGSFWAMKIVIRKKFKE